ncbi:MAG: acyl carrier protein [Actinomycetota bacterium]
MRTRARVRRFIVDELLDDRPTGDPLAQELLDSLAIEQLVAFCEEEFGVALEDDDLIAENFESLGAVASLVDRKLRGA